MQHGQGGYSMHRVKVYRLSTDGQWEDHGTGHIALEYLEQSDAMGLIVLSEADTNKTLLVHKIKHETSDGDVYQRAGDSTIITWHDTEVNTDFAVSFQEQVGCDTIWQQIQTVRRSDNNRGCGGDLRPRDRRMMDDYDAVAGVNLDGELGESDGAPSCSNLPPPELGHLEELSKVLASATPFQREKIASQLLRPGYLVRLLDLFRQCEDLEDTASLGYMYRVVRSIVMLNDPPVLEELLREDKVMAVLGALEYDPDLRTHQRHRDFLQSCVQFKQVVPITDPMVLAKIHQTYRIQYLKDVILPRTLDDATYATLSSLALFNNVEVISALQQDNAFLGNLFSALQAHSPGDAQWHDLVAFLQEFCSLARHLQQPNRQQLFTRLVQLGMFDVVTRILQHSEADVKLKATDVLMSFMIHDIDGLRHFLLHQTGHSLFRSLVMEVVGRQPFQQGEPASKGGPPAGKDGQRASKDKEAAPAAAPGAATAAPAAPAAGGTPRQTSSAEAPLPPATRSDSPLTTHASADTSPVAAVAAASAATEPADGATANKAEADAAGATAAAAAGPTTSPTATPSSALRGLLASYLSPAAATSSASTAAAPDASGVEPPGPSQQTASTAAAAAAGEAGATPPAPAAAPDPHAAAASTSQAGGGASGVADGGAAAPSVTGGTATSWTAPIIFSAAADGGTSGSVPSGTSNGDGVDQAVPMDTSAGSGPSNHEEPAAAAAAAVTANGPSTATAAAADSGGAAASVSKLPVIVKLSAEDEEELGSGGMSEQVLEMLKSLLDTETMESFNEKDEFLELFYDQFLIKMLTVLAEDREIHRHGSRRISATMLGHVIEVFSFCVQHHGYRSKYFILRQNVVDKVLKVMRRREMWLACAAIRFVRVCLGTKDEFYLRYLVRNNLFEPIMNAFFENGDRYNLLNSAVLDLVDVIRRDNLKEIIEHLVEHFSHKFDDVTYVDTFKSLKLKYEQAQEGGAPNDSHASANDAHERHHRGPAADDDPGGVPIGAIANIRGRTYVFNSATGDHLGAGTSAIGGGGRALPPAAGASGGGGMIGPQRRRREDRELDRDEENYFKEDEDDDEEEDDGGGRDAGSSGSKSAGDAPDGKASSGPSTAPLNTPRPGAAGGVPGSAATDSSPAAPLFGLLDYYGDADDDEGAGGGKADDPAAAAATPASVPAAAPPAAAPAAAQNHLQPAAATSSGRQASPPQPAAQRTEVPSRRHHEDSAADQEEARKRLKGADASAPLGGGPAAPHPLENGRLASPAHVKDVGPVG